MKEKTIFYVFLIVFISLCLGYLVFFNKPEEIPTVVFGSVAALFSFYAYFFSKENFRLELMEKRWDIYEKTLEFCSVVVTHGGLPPNSDNEVRNQSIINGLIAANNSFRGIGYHKARSLFGDDIHELFGKLNKSYAWLISNQNLTPRRAAELAEQRNEHLTFIWDTVNKLPDLFKPYVYFGDYKNKT